jgi:hypothetical protein
MSRQLLVPLKGGDRVDDVLPYVRDVAQPGMTVVFLVHFGVNRFKEMAAQLLAINSGLPANFDEGPSAAPLSNIERSIQQAGEKLRRRGVAIKVKFYTGSLRRLMRQCMDDEPVKWVIMRPARSRLRRWCHAVATALRVAGPPAPAPVELFDPNSLAQR